MFQNHRKDTNQKTKKNPEYKEVLLRYIFSFSDQLPCNFELEMKVFEMYPPLRIPIF